MLPNRSLFSTTTCTNAVLRGLGVESKDELDITVSTAKFSEMISESVSKGLLDQEEHKWLTRALQIRTRVVADVARLLADIRAVPVATAGCSSTVDAVERALAQTGYYRFPVVGLDSEFVGYLHIKDVLTLGDDRQTVIDLALVRPLPEVPESLPLADAFRRCVAATAIWHW